MSLPIAWELVLRYHSVVGDAQSRLANAYYMLYSRDPHAAAIGFVWNPLPSLADLPLLLFRHLWPVLSVQSFAANLVSCAAYAAACYQLYRFFEDLRLNRVARWGLWLCFAANPLVFYYGVNGMSEMLFMLTLIVTARYLSQWLESESPRALAISGFALGFAYLARNEAVAPAVAAGILVVVVSYARAEGTPGLRRMEAGVDVSLFLAPFVLAFAVWALMGWIIVGHPFEQFSSVYGNASQIRLAGPIPSQRGVGARLGYAVLGSQSVAPLLVGILVAAIVRAWRRRDLRILATVAVMASVLGFEIVAYTVHQIFPWYRYYIYACPAAVMAAAYLAVPSVQTTVVAAGRSVVHITARAAGAMLTAMALVLAAPGLMTTADTLGTVGGIASSDRYQLAYFLWPHAADARNDPVLANYHAVKLLAAQLDALRLPHGAVMVDNFTACIVPLILDSSHPKQFVIPNDQDYEEKFGVPYQFGVRYFLVPNPVTNPVDALNRHLPNLYANGQGLATLVRQISLPGCPTLRLYRALPSSG